MLCIISSIVAAASIDMTAVSIVGGVRRLQVGGVKQRAQESAAGGREERPRRAPPQAAAAARQLQELTTHTIGGNS